MKTREFFHKKTELKIFVIFLLVIFAMSSCKIYSSIQGATNTLDFFPTTAISVNSNESNTNTHNNNSNQTDESFAPVSKAANIDKIDLGLRDLISISNIDLHLICLNCKHESYIMNIITGKVIQRVHFPDQITEIRTQPLENGYAFIYSYASNEPPFIHVICDYYNKQCVKDKSFDLSKVFSDKTGRDLLGIAYVSLTTDGKKIALSDFHEIWILDLETNLCNPLFSLEDQNSTLQNVLCINRIAFTTNSALLFTASSNLGTLQGEMLGDNYSSIVTIELSNLSVRLCDLKEISLDYFYCYDDLSIFSIPYLGIQAGISKSDGKILVFKPSSQETVLHTPVADPIYESGHVYGSYSGNYYATATINNAHDHSVDFIRIYDTKTGELIHKHNFCSEHSDIYHSISGMLIIDDVKVCVLACKNNSTEYYKIFSFEF